MGTERFNATQIEQQTLAANVIDAAATSTGFQTGDPCCRQIQVTFIIQIEALLLLFNSPRDDACR